MKSSRFTEDQIIGVLKKDEGGMKVGEICREHGICDQTYYRWKARYGGLEVSEARRRRQWLKEEIAFRMPAAGNELGFRTIPVSTLTGDTDNRGLAGGSGMTWCGVRGGKFGIKLKAEFSKELHRLVKIFGSGAV